MIARRLLLGATLATPAIARAQGVWPTRPVRVVVPFPPGGSNDVMARPLAERLQARFGQPFVVENRGGASGSIGATAVAQAPADGHTLMVTSSSFATSAVLQKTTWDAERSFDAIAILARAPYYLLTNPDFPPRDVQSLVAWAKARPGAVDYGSSGTGGLNHVVSEYFCQAAGIRMTHVPYKGTAQAVTDLMAGTIQLVITTVASANSPIREGRVRVIAAAAPGGFLPPDVPAVRTVREQGVDYEADIWWGLLAPKNLPPAVRRSIHAAVTDALAEPALRRIYEAEGAVPSPGPYDEFAAVLRADMDRWRKVAEAANIRMD
jgi:tripartite-type tricarboxylate transporter receptor subunit TctC